MSVLSDLCFLVFLGAFRGLFESLFLGYKLEIKKLVNA